MAVCQSTWWWKTALCRASGPMQAETRRKTGIEQAGWSCRAYDLAVRDAGGLRAAVVSSVGEQRCSQELLACCSDRQRVAISACQVGKFRNTSCSSEAAGANDAEPLAGAERASSGDAGSMLKRRLGDWAVKKRGHCVKLVQSARLGVELVDVQEADSHSTLACFYHSSCVPSTLGLEPLWTAPNSAGALVELIDSHCETCGARVRGHSKARARSHGRFAPPYSPTTAKRQLGHPPVHSLIPQLSTLAHRAVAHSILKAFAIRPHRAQHRPNSTSSRAIVRINQQVHIERSS
ncbi:hypothetical protein L1887_55237 [Cichorium endivia]|nr:hypothetical protein L1887_55237 [Cichorium endivia]